MAEKVYKLTPTKYGYKGTFSDRLLDDACFFTSGTPLIRVKYRAISKAALLELLRKRRKDDYFILVEKVKDSDAPR